MSTSPAARSWARRMAEQRRRARLSPAAAAAAVALAEAQAGGLVENARPVTRGGRTFYRVEVVIEAEHVEALLDALESAEAVAE